MDERGFLLKKFRAFGCEKISEFTRLIQSDLSQESWGTALNRGNSINLRTLMVMCAELNCTSDELGSLLLARGEEKM